MTPLAASRFSFSAMTAPSSAWTPTTAPTFLQASKASSMSASLLSILSPSAMETLNELMPSCFTSRVISSLTPSFQLLMATCR